MTRKTRIVAALLAVVMLFSVVPAMPLTASAATAVTEADAFTAVDAYLANLTYEETAGTLRFQGSPWNCFWQDVESIEVIIDAYELSGNLEYLDAAEKLYDGFIARNKLGAKGTNWSGNDFNDDLMWGVIMAARLYNLTGDSSYLDTAIFNFDVVWERGWDESFKGGALWWKTLNSMDPDSKNACIECPAAIAACLLGDATGNASYYDKAKALIDWTITNLYQNDGGVWDSAYVDGTYNKWVSTYNQGTFIGACTMLSKHFTSKDYLGYAAKAAERATKLGLNGEQNSADLIGFKGILARWMGYYCRETGDATITSYMQGVADTVWNNRNSDNLMWTKFNTKTPDNLRNQTIDGVNCSNYAYWGASSGLSWIVNTPGVMTYNEAPGIPVENPADTNTTWSVVSPDGCTGIYLNLRNDTKALEYNVKQDGVQILQGGSEMGINTSVADFRTGLTFASKSERSVNETYDVISGKYDTHTNNFNEKTITFAAKNGYTFSVVVRAYNDGIAYRYLINGAARSMTIAPNSESTSFNLPNDSTVWFMERTGNNFMYENEYESAISGDMNGRQPSIPMLFEVGNKYGLILQADLNSTYCGSLLKGESAGEFTVISDLVQTGNVNTNVPFESPWRGVVIGSAAEIVENTMPDNLADAPDENKYHFNDWVDPGMSSWSWVTYYGNQQYEETHYKFIDLAVEMGWDYYLLDEEWQPKASLSGKTGCNYYGMQPWWPNVKAYAAEKGVDLLVWVHVNDVDTEAEREERFAEWAAEGIKGIKVDFFYNESQQKLAIMDAIYECAARNGLMVNVHGANVPTGESRTWPNVLTREAIRGQEQGGIKVEQFTLIPFIRAAVGSADTTEQLFSRDTGKTTMGFQIALSTLIQNGMHTMGSAPDAYYSVPEAISLYTNFPDTWDDMHVIDAHVGQKVDVARRAGEIWYAAGISVNATSVRIKTDFLDKDKTYTAIIYKEKANERQALEMVTVENVTSESTLPAIAVQAGGGYTVKLVPTEGAPKSIKLSPQTVTVERNFTNTVNVTFEPADCAATDVIWSVADPSVAAIQSSTGKSAVIKGLKENTTTTITATSVYDDSVVGTATIKVPTSRYTFHEIEAEAGNRTGAGITNNPEASGGQHVGNIKGDTATVSFTVNVPSDTTATIELYYATQSTRDFTVTANGTSATVTAEGNGSSWNTVSATPVSVQLPLKAGDNTITVGGNNGGDAPNLDYIVVYYAKDGYVAPSDPTGETYTAEAEGAALTNGAEAVTNDVASNGAHAGNIGGPTDGTVTFTVESPAAGTTTLNLYYISDQDRSFEVIVNGGAAKNVACPTGGSWTAPAATPATVQIDLVEGTNTIAISGVGTAYAPNLDYISMVLPAAHETVTVTEKIEMESGAEAGGAAEEANAGASAGYFVHSVGGVNGANGTVTHTYESDVAGKATITVCYGQNDTRDLVVSVNGANYTITDCPTTNGWYNFSGLVSVDVELKAGANTIVFGGNNGHAPNLDYFEITMEKLLNVPTEKAILTGGEVSVIPGQQVKVPLYLKHADALLELESADGTIGGLQFDVLYNETLELTGFELSKQFAGYDVGTSAFEDNRGLVLIANMDLKNALVSISEITDDTVIGYMVFNTGTGFDTTSVSFSEIALTDDVIGGDKLVEYSPYVTSESFTITKSDEVVKPEKWDISFSNMTLGNNLAMSFAFAANNEADWSGHYVEIVKTYADGRDDVVKTIAFKDWTPANINSTAHYSVTFDGVAAKEMSDNVYVTVYNADGVAVSNIYTMSVRAYAMKQLAAGKSDELNTTIVDMLNYGAASQKYLGYNLNDLANNQLTDAQKAMTTKSVSCTNSSVGSSNYRGTNLKVESSILLQMAFSNVDQNMRAVISFTDHYGRKQTIDVAGSEFEKAGNYYVVTVDQLVVADGRQLVTVQVYNGNTLVAEASDSMEGYCARAIERGGTNAEVFEMLMKFSDSAYAFFH